MPNLVLNIAFAFPISRNPPEGGTQLALLQRGLDSTRFQFLGIPPKGELYNRICRTVRVVYQPFPISRNPPEGGT